MKAPILIVEGHDTIRRLLGDWVSSVIPSRDVVTVASRDDAVRLAGDRSPRIVLIDVDSLQTGDVETVRGIKTVVPDADIVVLAMRDHEAYRHDLAKAGASALVMTWQISEKLQDVLEALLGLGGAAGLAPAR